MSRLLSPVHSGRLKLQTPYGSTCAEVVGEGQHTVYTVEYHAWNRFSGKSTDMELCPFR